MCYKNILFNHLLQSSPMNNLVQFSIWVRASQRQCATLYQELKTKIYKSQHIYPYTDSHAPVFGAPDLLQIARRGVSSGSVLQPRSYRLPRQGSPFFKELCLLI